MKTRVAQKFNSLLLFIGMMGISTIHAQEIGRRYYFDEDDDSCTLEKATYYHEYTELEDDPDHYVLWSKKVDGTLQSKEEFLRPSGTTSMQLDGVQEYYWDSGQVKHRTTRQYLTPRDPFASDLHGWTESFFENGVQKRRDFYQNGLLVEGHCWTSKGQDTAYYIFEKKAYFPSSSGYIMGDLMRYIVSHTVYPNEAKLQGITGKVFVRFVIEKEGTITDVEAYKSVDKFLDHEAVRVIESMPNWEPAIYDGKPVRMSFTVPITFRLQ